MPTDLYVSISSQIALAARLEAVANNIANMNTAGFRAAGVKFEAVMSAAGGDQVAFASTGQTYISRKSGPLMPTGNNLDVAVDGDGWLALLSPDGPVYTRDGRFHLTELGDLRSVNGYSVLDLGGSPVTLDPSAGPIEIGEDGRISQAGKQVGAIGLFLLPETAHLTRYDNSAVVPDQPATPVEDMTINSVRQGYVEGANVNPILEMTKLMEISRAFDAAAAAIEQSDEMAGLAIRTLAPA